MGKIHAITYVTPKFSGAAKCLGLKVIQNDFSSFTRFNESDLDPEFKDNNAETLAFERGGGYWIWKPYVILKGLRLHNGNGTLMYNDAGLYPLLNAKDYISLAEDSKIHVWAVEGQDFRSWTHIGVLDEFGVGPGEQRLEMAMAGIILSNSTSQFLNFLEDWLSLCQIPRFLRPETLTGFQNNSETIWHRHDQSILNILIRKNPENFVVHSLNTDGLGSIKYFNIHRNLSIKHSIIIYSFPKIRKFRNCIVNLLPKRLRSSLRFFKTSRLGKNLSDEETLSLRKSY